jgi:endonuclease YncB( thermonuclease family)
MLTNGWAWHFTKYDDSREFAAAEAEARKERRGLWADPKPVPPWEWRKLSKEERDAERKVAPKE